MKAFNKFLTASPGSGLRKRLGLTRKRGIMSREQGMMKFEVLNLIVQYLLFHGRYGILNRRDAKVQRQRENRVGMISLIPGKSYIGNTLRNLFFLFMEYCSEKINMMMMRRNSEAMEGCYKWTREKWLNLTVGHIRGKKENAIALPGGKSRSKPSITNSYFRHILADMLPPSDLFRNRELPCTGKIPCKQKPASHNSFHHSAQIPFLISGSRFPIIDF